MRRPRLRSCGVPIALEFQSETVPDAENTGAALAISLFPPSGERRLPMFDRAQTMVHGATGRAPLAPTNFFTEGKMKRLDYSFTIRPLAKDEGGGYLIETADLPGCISDGETPEEAIRNGADAARSWISAMRQAGRQPMPLPPNPARRVRVRARTRRRWR